MSRCVELWANTKQSIWDRQYVSPFWRTIWLSNASNNFFTSIQLLLQMMTSLISLSLPQHRKLSWGLHLMNVSLILLKSYAVLTVLVRGKYFAVFRQMQFWMKDYFNILEDPNTNIIGYRSGIREHFIKFENLKTDNCYYLCARSKRGGGRTGSNRQGQVDVNHPCYFRTKSIHTSQLLGSDNH